MSVRLRVSAAVCVCASAASGSASLQTSYVMQHHSRIKFDRLLAKAAWQVSPNVCPRRLVPADRTAVWNLIWHAFRKTPRGVPQQ